MDACVSVIIPVWNRVELTLSCLTSLSEQDAGAAFELIVVDNGSTDATPDLLAALGGDVQIIMNSENRGFGEACNQGAAAASGEYLLFLNNDTIVGPGWLAPLVACLDEDARRGAVQPRLLYPDGRLNDAGGLVFAHGQAWNYGKGSLVPYAPRFSCRRAPDYVTGACLLVRRNAFEAVGGFDPRYAPAYYEDVDLSFALRAAGWTLVYEPASTIVHVEGGTAGSDTSVGLKAYQVRNQARFAEKWADELAQRPALDPARVEAWAHRPQAGWGPGEADQAVSETDPERKPEREPAARSILVFDPFPPIFDRAAGSLRLLNLVRCLRQSGHAVAWYAGGEAAERERYQKVLSDVGVPLYGMDRGEIPTDTALLAQWSPEYVPAVESLIADRAADLVIVTPWDLAELVLPRLKLSCPDVVTVVDTCDLHFVREEREALLIGSPSALAEAGSCRRRELGVYVEADVVVCVSEEEAAVLAEALPATATAIVGLGQGCVDQGPEFEERRDLLFVGNANHAPNVDAVRWWRNEIAPLLGERLPGVGLTVIGNDPLGTMRQLAGPGVDVKGWVPETLPYLHRARLSVAPLRYGAGVNGKVAEALTAGLPTVMTSTGAGGLGLRDGDHCLIADDAEGFVDAIVRAYTHHALWTRLRQAGTAHIAGVAGLGAMRTAVDRMIAIAVPARPVQNAPRLSLVMNVRNEARHLGDALGTCTGIEEIVVADMGSTDGSIAVAQAAGATVLHVEPSGYCETARQTAIDAATGDWVLLLDADERLSPGGLDQLRALAARTPPEVSAYRLPEPTFVGSRRLWGTGWGLEFERHTRFFRRSDVTWPRLIHSEPKFTGAIAELPPGVTVTLDHYCFADVEAAIGKFNRYSSVEATEHHDDGAVPASALDALHDGIAEFVYRYEPETDGGLSLTLAMGMFLYRFLTGMKRQELAGWPGDATLPARQSMVEAWAAFESTLRTLETDRAARAAAGAAGAAVGDAELAKEVVAASYT